MHIQNYIHWHHKHDSETQTQLTTVSSKLHTHFLFRLPTVESILEIMINFADPKAKALLNDTALCVTNDMQ